MNSLVNVTECNGKQTVSARELHTALGVKRDFSTWIKSRIEEYGFMEGEDYSPNLGNRSDGRPGKPRRGYQLSIGMAKELAMLENNETGRQVRKRLIALEEAWNSPETVMRRALQIAGSRDAEIGLYGEAAKKLRDAEKQLMKEMPGEKGREKAGENLAPAAMRYRHAVYDLQTVAVVTAIRYDVLRRKTDALEQHYGITDKMADGILFDARERLGRTWYWELGATVMPKLPGGNAPALGFAAAP
jgi:phage anti-repressor protein